MRRNSPCRVFRLWLGAGLLVGVALRAAPAQSDGRTWKPTVDWYAGSEAAQVVPRTVEQSELRFHSGDDLRWASPAWDDSRWKVIDRRQLPGYTGIFWLRLRIRTHGAGERVPSLLFITGTHELYWDGERINASGSPGSSPGTEVPGTNRVELELPASATTAGEHVLALRMSTYQPTRIGSHFAPLTLLTLPPDAFRDLDRKQNMQCAMGAGAMLTMGIAIFVVWFIAARRSILLLMFTLCLSAALLIAVSSAPSIWIFSGTFTYWHSLARVVLVVVVASLMVGTVSLQFHPARRSWLLAPFAIEAIAAWWWLPQWAGMFVILWRLAFGAVLLLAAEAIWRRREGAWWVFAGGLAAIMVFEPNPRHFEHARFLAGFLPMEVGLIAAIAITVRRERLAAYNTKLTAARLEIELLRKNLQPHFLLNTLTALAQVVEEKPSAAVSLINDLAVELRALSRLSTEKQVPLREEIALCRAHLRVMSARTERAWSLETDGINPEASVPPALFLTLIENGFSHQRVANGDCAFRLRAERIARATRYTFSSPGAVTAPAHENGGTGLRYVRSRLDESFHGAWTLSQRPIDHGWETVIELRHGDPQFRAP